MPARENILARIRSANNARALGDKPAKVADRLARHPRGPMPKMEWDPLQRFKDCSLAAASTLDEVKSLAEVPQAIARYIKERDLPVNGVCWPELGDLDWSGAGLRMEPRAASGDDMVGVTGVYCGLAETGTLVLLSGENQHTTTSLLPETHIAVVPVSRIVASMEDV